MIKHLVFMKFIDSADKSDNLKRIKVILDSLPEKIAQIKSFQVGIDELKSDRSFDLSIVSDFETWQDLEDYKNHPEHLSAVTELNKYREKTHFVDYNY